MKWVSMASIGVQFDFGECNRRQKAAAKHAAHTRKWMASQTTNVLLEARNGSTNQMRLRELAMNGDAKVRIAVAANANADAATLIFLSGVDLITSEISQKLVRNPNTPVQALVNVKSSPFFTWFGNRDKLLAHPNWTARATP